MYLLIILATATIGFMTQAPARQPDGMALPSRDAPNVTLSIRYPDPGLPSNVEIQLTPSDAAGGGELFLSMTRPNSKGYLRKRRVLTPATQGVYRLKYLFPESGMWYFYVRYGSGQAGFRAMMPMVMDPRVGGEDRVTMRMRRGLSNGVPVWIQPLGYAVFGLVAALALIGVLAILNHLRRTTQSPHAAHGMT